MRQKTLGVWMAAGLLSFGAAASAQTTIYETGFENPPFTAGSTLEGADSWLIQSTPQTPLFAIAQTAQANGGTQGAEVQATQATGGSGWAWKDVAFNPVSAGTPFVTVTWDMNVAATGTISQAGVDFYSAVPFARLVALGVSATNVVNYLSSAGVFTNTTATITRGQWYSFKAVFDYNTNQVDFFMNGVQIASDVAFPAGSDFGDADLWKGGTGTAHFYFDNFKIVADDSAGCYPDCNGDGVLTVADFGCFQTKFVGADPYADCNGDGQRTVADFGCFQTKFVAGCP